MEIKHRMGEEEQRALAPSPRHLQRERRWIQHETAAATIHCLTHCVSDET